MGISEPSSNLNSVAILGGSFDPVHLGHLAVADVVYQKLQPNKLKFMPNKIAPHKGGFYCDEKHRLAMLELALKETPYEIETLELEQNSVSYSVQSMRLLRQKLGEKIAIQFIVGYDSLLNLNSWWHWQRLFDFVNLVVVGRPGYDEQLHKDVKQFVETHEIAFEDVERHPNGKIVILPSSEKMVSSSELRAELQSLKSDCLLNDQKLLKHLDVRVADYIKQHNLYTNAE